MDARSVRRLAGGVAVGLVGLGAGYGLARIGLASSSSGERLSIGAKLARVGLGALSVWFALLLHEVGHLAGGLSQGFRLVFLAAGPLWLERGETGLALRFNRTAQTWGGMAAAMPPDGVDLRRRFAVMVAGGPLASLLLALVAGGAWALLPEGAARFTAAATALASAAFFLATAQPFGAGGGFASDGGRLVRLWRKGPEGEREVSVLALTATAMGGTRPRDWPSAIVEAALRPGDGSITEIAARVYAAQRASDVGDPGGAADHLDRALEISSGASPLLRSVVAVEAAWLRAARGDVEGAGELLPLADGPFVEEHARRRARAEWLRAGGDLAGARAEAEAGIAALGRARFGRPSARDRELLEAIRDGASEGGPAAPAAAAG